MRLGKITLGALVMALFFPSSLMAGGLDFKLKNETAYDIQEVHVDPTSSGSWSGNILDQEVLKDGTYADVTFSGDPESCKWDIKVDWVGDYEPVVWQGLNLCKISEITLKYDSETDETTADLH